MLTGRTETMTGRQRNHLILVGTIIVAAGILLGLWTTIAGQ
jgi:hypothetical protein